MDKITYTAKNLEELMVLYRMFIYYVPICILCLVYKGSGKKSSFKAGPLRKKKLNRGGGVREAAKKFF